MIGNLFICFTPLQALIAQQLIKQHNNRPAHLLMLCYADADNAKFQHYFQQTALLCTQAAYVLIPQKPMQRLFHFSKLLPSLAPEYHCIFAASIDNANVQYVISHLIFQHLETFDDGTGNLYPDSVLYHNKPLTLWRKWLNQLLGIHYQTEDLRQLSRCHHTLYPELPNIVSPSKALNLWTNQTHTPLLGSLKTEKIFLGQPILSQPQLYTQLLTELTQQFAIEHYFPHPRETMLPEQLNIINTPLIFEDWLLQRIESEPNTQFELYHFASSAALNTVSFPRVRIYALHPQLPFFQQSSFIFLYQLMSKLNITVYEI